MAPTISEELLIAFSDFISEKLGLYYAKERLRDLVKGLASASRQFGFDNNIEACVKWLMSSSLTRQQVEILAGNLTIGETYFFRDKKIFEAIQWHILPHLVQVHQNKDRLLRIWSVGCATGEEPYSLAILIDKTVPEIKTWNISILATDINPLFLAKASHGVYSKWSFRDTPDWVQNGYFTKSPDDRFEISPSIRSMVNFAYQNLAEDPFPSLISMTNAIDLILCRNVLMYFSQQMKSKVIDNLYKCLIEHGYFFVSPSEVSSNIHPKFKLDYISGAAVYRKTSFEEAKKELPKKPIKTSSSMSSEQHIAPLEAPKDHARLKATKHQKSIPKVIDNKVPDSELLTNNYEQALAYYNQGNYVEAINKLRDTIAIAQKADTQEMALLARAYANQGKLTEALEWSSRAVEADKMNPNQHFLLATILQEQGKIEEAIDSLKRSLYLDHNFALAHFTLGILMYQQGNVSESERYFRNSLAILSKYQKEDVISASDGLTAGRLIEIIQSTYLMEQE